MQDSSCHQMALPVCWVCLLLIGCHLQKQSHQWKKEGPWVCPTDKKKFTFSIMGMYDCDKLVLCFFHALKMKTRRTLAQPNRAQWGGWVLFGPTKNPARNYSHMPWDPTKLSMKCVSVDCCLYHTHRLYLQKQSHQWKKGGQWVCSAVKCCNIGC